MRSWYFENPQVMLKCYCYRSLINACLSKNICFFTIFRVNEYLYLNIYFEKTIFTDFIN